MARFVGEGGDSSCGWPISDQLNVRYQGTDPT